MINYEKLFRDRLAGLYSRHTTYRDQRGYSQEKFYFDIRAKELIGALLLGSMLDFDHFFAANAMSLTAATTLHSRPKGHAVLFVVLAMVRLPHCELSRVFIVILMRLASQLLVQFLCFFIASLTLPPRKRCYRYRLALLVGVSLFSHQLRDATRRGLWLYPLDKNIPVSYSGYLMGLFCIVCSVHYLSMNVSKFSHVTMSSQEVSDSFGVYPPDSV